MYMEFRNFAVDFNEKTRTFSCLHTEDDGMQTTFLRDVKINVRATDGSMLSIFDFPECKVLHGPGTFGKMTVELHGGPEKILPMSVTRLHFQFHNDCLELAADRENELWLSGHIINGDDPEHAVFAACDESFDNILRNADGPAANPRATMLYNRADDRALTFRNAGKFGLHFDWEAHQYAFGFLLSQSNPTTFRFETNVLSGLFHQKAWKSISKKHQFATPPIGWMTWYAVRFGACEKVVLDNARMMKEKFGKYAEKLVIWVDWEWCHRSLDGKDAGCDVLTPRADAYPNGLKFVSDAIRKLGLIPALWTGATNDGRRNALLKEHPEWVLGEDISWCGNTWLDLSHPEVIKEYIPRLFRQILDWGYQAIKWDCLSATLVAHDKFHDRFYDPKRSSEGCVRNAVAAARKTIGDEIYFLGCVIEDRTLQSSCDTFDAVRVGGDVFSWQEFRENAVNRTLVYYPMHNTRLFLDPDTLVLREEYSTEPQARTRVSFFALTGMMLTVGDPVSALDAPRIDMLRRAMPVPELRPTELMSKPAASDVGITVTAVARPFGSWYVAGIYNLSAERQQLNLNFDTVLGLPDDEYAVYDFWKQTFLGVMSCQTELALAAGDSTVLRLTPVKRNEPVLIGSSRHIMQGAVELAAAKFDAASGVFAGSLQHTAGEAVKLTFLMPANYTVKAAENVAVNGACAILTCDAAESGCVKWQIEFVEKN